jgi:hypothetical protein
MSGKKPTIEEISTNGECRQWFAKIGPYGFEDDRTQTPGITILNGEVPHFLYSEFGEPVFAGQLGDNILIKGYEGNISELPIGTRIIIEKEVVLEVVARATHYTKKRFPTFSKEVLEYLNKWGGVTCKVVEGVGRRVWDEYEVEIILPDKEVLKGAA